MEDSGNVVADTTGWLCCLPCWWLRRNTSVHRATVSVAMLLIMSLLVASPVLFLISTAPSGSRAQHCALQESESGCTIHNDVCGTSECRGAAGRLEAALSWRVDPCDDFYGFACEGWYTHHGLKTRQARVTEQIKDLLQENTRSGIYRKLGDYYRSCLQARTKSITSEMLSLLKDLGGYIPSDIPVPPDLNSLLGKLFRVNGDPLFDIYVDRDLHNHSRFALFVDLPRRLKYNSGYWLHIDYQKMYDSGHSDGCRYRSQGNWQFVHTKDQYEEKRQLIMKNMLESFVPTESLSGVNESHNILSFASLINKSPGRLKEHGQQPHTEYNVYQVQRLYHFIRWIPLLTEALNVSVTAHDVIYIMAPIYMSNVARTLALFHPRTVHNAVLTMYATDTLAQLIINGNERSELCTRVMTDILPDAVSALYVSQYSQHTLDVFRIKIGDIFNNVKNTLKARIRSVPWMDDTTKTAALRKVSTLRLQWPPPVNATTLLHHVEVDPNNFFQNVIKRYRQMRNFNENYYKSASLTRWTFPLLVNSFYDPTLNSIVVPVAALIQPYFQDNLPQYIPYGMMGMVFSHGILHAFDLVGTEYDESGSKVSWMLPETKLRLQARLECIVKQYSTMHRKEADFTSSTVDVPVLCSDISSKEHVIHVQEDFHTHASERVNSIMMNSVEFAESFGCTTGRKMNPSKKCSLF